MTRAKTKIITTLLAVTMAFSLTACTNQDDIDNAVTPLSEQITTINATLTEMQTLDTTLDGYIDALESKVATLETDLAAVNTTLETLEENSATKTALTETKTALESEINAIKEDIKALEEKDTKLDGKITALQTALSTEITDTEKWVNDTFATKAACDTLKTEINETIATLQGKIDGLETSVKTLNTTVTALQTQVDKNKQDIADLTELINNLKNCINDRHSFKSESINYVWADDCSACTAEVECEYCEREITETAVGVKSDDLITAEFATDVFETQTIINATSMTNDELQTAISTLLSQGETHINLALAENADVSYIATALNESNVSQGSIFLMLNGVTSIGDSAFSDCASLKSVTIGNGVTNLGNLAFADCWSLTSVTIGNGVTSIGYRAFSNCPNLESVTIPDNVTSIGDCAFESCTNLKSVTIPDNVTSIGARAFEWCESLTSITVDENNSAYKSIDGDLYSKDGTTLIQYAIGKPATSFTIPEGVTSISNSAFYACDSLESVTIPDNVTSIGVCAFDSCTSLGSVTIGNGVTNIGIFAFSRCTSLTSINVDENNTVYKSIDGNLYSKDGTTLIQYAIGKPATSFTIPEGVTSIGDDAFEYCASLKSVTIGGGVTSIGERAFFSCESLESVTIPDSVTSIGDTAFRYCESLKSVYYIGSAEAWANITVGSYNDPLTSATRYYYIEKETDVPTDGGNYWHYDENGNIVVWNTSEE